METGITLLIHFLKCAKNGETLV